MPRNNRKKKTKSVQAQDKENRTKASMKQQSTKKPKKPKKPKKEQTNVPVQAKKKKKTAVVPATKTVVQATKPRTRAPVVVVDSAPVCNGVLNDYARITGKEEELAALLAESEEAMKVDEGGMKARKKAQKKEGLKEFNKEVENLGATAFKGREKRDWDKKKLVEMGGVVQRNQSMPRTMHMGMRAKQKKREDWNNDLLRNMGLTVKKRAKIAEKENADGGVIWGRSSLNPTVGSFKNGVLSMKRKHIKSVHQNATKRPKPIHKLMKR